MNIVNWLDLYNFLYEQANSPKNIGKFNWQNPVTIHNAETGDEYNCDIYSISTQVESDKIVLVINGEEIFN